VAVETDRESLLAKIKGNTDASDNTKTLITSLETQVKTHETKITSLASEVASKQEEIAQLQGSVKETEAMVETVKEEKSKELDDLMAKATTKSRDLRDKLQKQVAEAEGALKEAQEALELRVEEHKILTSAAVGHRQAVRDGEGVIGQLRKENAELQQDFEKLQAELGTVRTEQRGEIDSVDAKRAAIEKELKSAKEAIEQREADHVLALQQVEERCSLEITSLKTSLMSAQQVRDNATKDLSRLKVDHEQLLDQRQAFDNNELHDEVRELTLRLKSAEAAKESSDDALAVAVESLKADADAKDQIIHKLQADLEIMSRDGSQQLYVLQNQVVALQGQLTSDQDGYAAKYTELQTQYQLLDEQNEQIRGMYESLQTELKESNDKIDGREAVVLSLQAERDHLLQTMRQQIAATPSEDTNANDHDEMLDGMTREEVMDELQKREDEAHRLQAYVDRVLTLVAELAPEITKELDRKLNRLSRSASRRGNSVRGSSRRSSRRETKDVSQRRESLDSNQDEPSRRASSRRSDRESRRKSQRGAPDAEPETVEGDGMDGMDAIVTSQEDASS